MHHLELGSQCLVRDCTNNRIDNTSACQAHQAEWRKYTPNIALIKLDQESVECYKGLEKLNHGIHRLEDQILNVIDDDNEDPPLIILVQPDTTVWKLYVHHVVL